MAARITTGAKTKDLCRRHAILEAMYYNWKAKYADLTPQEFAKRGAREEERVSLSTADSSPSSD